VPNFDGGLYLFIQGRVSRIYNLARVLAEMAKAEPIQDENPSTVAGCLTIRNMLMFAGEKSRQHLFSE
jgi:hypothetical protein